MTIAISLKVHDGLVLAADSASTLIGQDPAGGSSGVMNVYNNANKVFNLRKGSPIGMITWGSGSIGKASISTLAKDLRKRFSGEDSAHTGWTINPGSYTVAEIAQRAREFMYDELYMPTFGGLPTKPPLSFVVAGYSANQPMAEEYHVEIKNGACAEPQQVGSQGEAHIFWEGQPEAINRLLLGYGLTLPSVLQQNLGVPSDQIKPAMSVIEQALSTPLIEAAMPIQDAIDLAEFLVNVTVGYMRFKPGAPSVGGPIEIAAITKHEGFKWIRRKHYYNYELNREET